MTPTIGLMSFDEQPTPERPDYRRVTEHVGFKRLPLNMQALIEAEFRRYDETLKRSEGKLHYLRAGLTELTERSM